MEKLYSVLLVNDEAANFSDRMKNFDWEKMGFQIAGYARNGVEALEMAEKLQPDIVLTEYFLKSVSCHELREVFGRIKGNLERELDEKRTIEKWHAYSLESLSALREKFCISLIEGRVPAAEVKKYCKRCQMLWNKPYAAAAILHISAKEPQEREALYFLKLSVKQLAAEQLSHRWNVYPFFYLGEIVLIAQLANLQESAVYTEELDKFCKLASHMCNAAVTAGIGEVCEDAAELPDSYQGARMAVACRVLMGSMRAISIAELDTEESAQEAWEEEAIGQILKKIKTGDVLTLKEAVRASIAQLAKYGTSLQKYQIFLTELIAEIFRFASFQQLDLEELFGKNTDIYAIVFQMESLEALEAWILKIGYQMQQMIQSGRRNTTKFLVQKAIDYVREHYADAKLNVECVCKNLSVSTAYFSTVFKKETGKTFIHYLTDYRMEQAVDLLMNQDEKTYVIAEKVGYSDPNYFSYVFKKQFGMSPSKYRAEKRKSGHNQ